MADKAKFWCQKGNTYLKSKQYDLALRCYDQSLALNPDYAEAIDNKVVTCLARVQELLCLQDYELALTYCDEALALKPDNLDCLKQQQCILIYLESKIHFKKLSFAPKIGLDTDNLSDLSKQISVEIADQEKILSRMIKEKIDHVMASFFSSTKQPIASPSVVAEMAALSRDVYFVDPNYDPSGTQVRLPLPPGWTLYSAFYSPVTGYTGAVYMKDEHSVLGPTYIVHAHKGTTFTTTSDLIADLEVLNNTALTALFAKINTCFDYMAAVGQDIFKKFGEKQNNATQIMTGHSLGAVLAQITGVGIQAITFENPGSKNLIIDFYKKTGASDQVIAQMLSMMSSMHSIYNADINAINTCHEQIGSVYRLINLPYNFYILNNELQLIPSHWWLNLNYAYYTVLDQHDCQKISDYLKSGGAVAPASYPASITSGYKAYLNPARSNYWNAYAQEIWNRKEIIREQFKEFSVYLSYFNEQLAKVWEEASDDKKLKQTSLDSASNLIVKAPIQGSRMHGIFHQSTDKAAVGLDGREVISVLKPNMNQK